MIWAILLVFVVVIGFMSLVGRKQVSWSKALRRVNAGRVRQAEWMAPESVTLAVKNDYLGAIQWLIEDAHTPWTTRWNKAPQFLSGRSLRRHQEILKQYHIGGPPRFTGVLRCTHDVTIRHFSEDGERCLVVDRQTNRCMETYPCGATTPGMTQRLEDGTAVYEMVYDKQDRRWKVDHFIQELPGGWKSSSKSPKIRLLSVLPPTIGRDN